MFEGIVCILRRRGPGEESHGRAPGNASKGHGAKGYHNGGYALLRGTGDAGLEFERRKIFALVVLQHEAAAVARLSCSRDRQRRVGSVSRRGTRSIAVRGRGHGIVGFFRR